MMHTWFECRVRYEKVMENGMNKKVTEPYLVDALSFTEAEARIIEELTPFISSELTIAAIKKVNYSEVFPSEQDSESKWYSCKVEFIILDEKNGTEKKTKVNMLVQASDPTSAVENLRLRMKGTLADYNVIGITETSLYDVFTHI